MQKFKRERPVVKDFPTTQTLNRSKPKVWKALETQEKERKP